MFAAHRFAQAHNGVSTSGVKAVDSARCTCRVLVETKVIRGLDKPLKRGDKARRTDPDSSGTLTILATSIMDLSLENIQSLFSHHGWRVGGVVTQRIANP